MISRITFSILSVLVTTGCILCSTRVAGQKSTLKNAIAIGFYNVENLFDTLDTPEKDDAEFLPQSEKSWNTIRYSQKIKNISNVLSQLGGVKGGPAVIGLCEVENENVLKDLVKAEKLQKGNYKYVFHDGPDERGIDVAFLYQSKIFTLTSYKSHPLHIEGDTSFHTRDQLVVSGKLKGQEMHFIICHWPSRRGGEEGSRKFRVAAAELARHLVDSLQKINKDARIIVMGDLNDDPTDVSVKKAFGTTDDASKSCDSLFYNAMETMFTSGKGTLTYKGKWNLFDQMLVSPSLAKSSAKSPAVVTAGIFDTDWVKESEGKYKGEPLRTFAGNKYLGGYSDHLAVYLLLRLK